MIETTRRVYIVYQCADSSETRGRTKQERTPSCGAWNIQKSRRKPTVSPSHQGRCKCGKRTNLSKRNTWEFTEEIDAFKFVMQKSLEAEE